jgi:hypothetical protein
MVQDHHRQKQYKKNQQTLDKEGIALIKKLKVWKMYYNII